MAIFGGYFDFECLQLFGGDRPGKWNGTFYVNPCGSDDIPFGIKDEGELHGVLTLMAVNRRSVNFPLRSRDVVSTVTVRIVAWLPPLPALGFVRISSTAVTRSTVTKTSACRRKGRTQKLQKNVPSP
jgi:hypothetical protein